MFEALTLDQIGVFLSVVDTGSFSAAARKGNRAPSAISYAIQKMEDQLGVPIFNRSSYRPLLTQAGMTLLPRARRVAEEVSGLRIVASGIANGLEPELSIAVDSMFPMTQLAGPLQAFQVEFPSVQLIIQVEDLRVATRLVVDTTCDIGLLSDFSSEDAVLAIRPIAEAALVMVASPNHLLAQIRGPIGTAESAKHTQLVLSDITQRIALPDRSVFTSKTWRIGDLGAKHEMLVAGLGFGSLPKHMAQNDIVAGRLVVLDFENGFGEELRFPLAVCHRRDHPVRQAMQWLLQRFVSLER